MARSQAYARLRQLRGKVKFSRIFSGDRAEDVERLDDALHDRLVMRPPFHAFADSAGLDLVVGR